MVRPDASRFRQIEKRNLAALLRAIKRLAWRSTESAQAASYARSLDRTAKSRGEKRRSTNSRSTPSAVASAGAPARSRTAALCWSRRRDHSSRSPLTIPSRVAPEPEPSAPPPCSNEESRPTQRLHSLRPARHEHRAGLFRSETVAPVPLPLRPPPKPSEQQRAIRRCAPAWRAPALVRRQALASVSSRSHHS
jgi:hypothetical protein